MKGKRNEVCKQNCTVFGTNNTRETTSVYMFAESQKNINILFADIQESCHSSMGFLFPRGGSGIQPYRMGGGGISFFLWFIVLMMSNRFGASVDDATPNVTLLIKLFIEFLHRPWGISGGVLKNIFKAFLRWYDRKKPDPSRCLIHSSSWICHLSGRHWSIRHRLNHRQQVKPWRIEGSRRSYLIESGRETTIHKTKQTTTTRAGHTRWFALMTWWKAALAKLE